MNKLGTKIAEKRKSLGMTQIEFAEKMHVTRQTVSRWEAGTAMPDIDKISEIADILGASCDYLLKDEAVETGAAQTRGVAKLLKSLTGRTVQLAFFDEEADIDLLASLTDGLSGADLKAVCTEAGMFAIRQERDVITVDDFMDAIEKVMNKNKEDELFNSEAGVMFG